MAKNAWLLMAVSGTRQHGGNDGYDDDPAASYAWDSTVPNRDKLQEGDYIVLWDKNALLGVSVIDQILIGESEKVVHRCPKCDRSGIKERKTRSPRYNCYKCKAKFDQPKDYVERVQTYRSQHSSRWIPLDGLLSGSELRSLCVNPRSQLSLRPFRWNEFVGVVNSKRQDQPLRFIDTVEARIAGGHKTRSVRVRLGQGEFRRRLLKKFGETCAFTGPTPGEAIQACHLYSYAERGEHHEAGGLLLRSDLHTLFDLGRIAVNPKTKRLDLAEELRTFPEYGRLHDQSVVVRLSPGHVRWLKAHWEMHRSSP